METRRDRATDGAVRLVGWLVFGLPVVVALAWLASTFFFVTVLGRPDLCPLNSC